MNSSKVTEKQHKQWSVQQVPALQQGSLFGSCRWEHTPVIFPVSGGILFEHLHPKVNMSWWLILESFEIWSPLSYLTLLCMLLIVPYWPNSYKNPALLFSSLTFSLAYSTDSLHPVQRMLFFFLYEMPFSFIKFCFSLPLHALWPEVGWATSPLCVLSSGTDLSIFFCFGGFPSHSKSQLKTPPFSLISIFMLLFISEATLVLSVKWLRDGLCMMVRIQGLIPLTFTY